MSERLTDAELTEALEVAQGLHSLKLTAAVAELIDRRRADLTSEERDALRVLVRSMTVRNDNHNLTGWQRRALAVLDKLLGEGQR